MMRVIFHPSAYADLALIMNYYERTLSSELADEFFDEFQTFVDKVAERPESFALVKDNIRRANLDRFPYNFLFYQTNFSVKILVVRHHRRDPSYGAKRR
jgi:plasmid stabilization system protein ParE